MWNTFHGALRRANRLVALVLGLTLVAAAIFILIDITLRKLGLGTLGGSDEISGYVMAAIASWGPACALTERAHVRIDVLRQKFHVRGRMFMDMFAMIVTNGVILLIVVKCWPVLEKTLKRGSTANTPLETPMWIPQGIWFAGWSWFALSATALTLIGLAYLLQVQRAAFDSAIGMSSELDQ
nr:TRAP transporter small permease [uncultured Cohaesibacter sp.]